MTPPPVLGSGPRGSLPRKHLAKGGRTDAIDKPEETSKKPPADELVSLIANFLSKKFTTDHTTHALRFCLPISHTIHM